MISIDLLSLGISCPLGLSALEAYAALEAGLRSIYRSEDAEALERAQGEVVRASRSLEIEADASRHARTSFYAQRALAEAMRPLGPAPALAALFLATPEPQEASGFEVRGMFGELAALFSAAHFFPHGRAGVFTALSAASAALERGECKLAVVGGADSLADMASLERLAHAGRLLGEQNPDGMIPGEGAAFLVLGRDGMAGDQPRLARLGPVVRAQEPEPALSGASAKGSGLSEVFAALARQHTRRVDLVHGAQTTQPYWTRELSLAATRCGALMPAPLALRRRAEALGELGAAAGAIALAAAVLDFHALVPERLRAAPSPERSLVYASADAGEIGACLLFSRPLHLLP